MCCFRKVDLFYFKYLGLLGEKVCFIYLDRIIVDFVVRVEFRCPRQYERAALGVEES